ncbi:MAG: VanZ family protein [Magnetococcales bacterium]|nr:VanZ family protein [Magnetococcales bacterium]
MVNNTDNSSGDFFVDNKPLNHIPWIITGVYLLAVYTFLPFAPVWFKSIISYTGYDGFSYIVTSISAISAIIVIKKVALNGFKIVLLAVAAIAFIALIASQMDKAAERLHFLEYAILGIMLYWAKGYPKGVGLVFVFLISAIAGGVDELIQYFLPNRYYDIRDIGFNVLGSGLGVVLGILMRPNKS